MKKLLALATIVLLTGADPKDDAVKDDLRLLQGQWRITGVTFGASPAPADYVRSRNATFEFKGDRCKLTYWGITREGKVRLRAGTSPRAADLVIENGDGTESTLEIIYEVTRDTLRIAEGLPVGCWQVSGKRPRSFDHSKEEAGQCLFVQSAIRPKS